MTPTRTNRPHGAIRATPELFSLSCSFVMDRLHARARPPTVGGEGSATVCLVVPAHRRAAASQSAGWTPAESVGEDGTLSTVDGKQQAASNSP